MANYTQVKFWYLTMVNIKCSSFMNVFSFFSLEISLMLCKITHSLAYLMFRIETKH